MLEDTNKISPSQNNIWLSIVQKYKNSVLQLICTIAKYDPYRPYRPLDDKRQSGSGFIIDIEKGLVITNAHVVNNVIAITGRIMALGEQDLSLTLISICREKDVAICQLSETDIKKVLTLDISENLNMQFADSLSLIETEEVCAIGYPLGQRNIKFTTGVISGFHVDDMEDNNTLETEEESPSYIQISAPINPGSSGGALVNKEGRVIGINSAGIDFAQLVGFAIASRTFLSIYNALISPLYDKNILVPNVVITPKYSFTYNKASKALLELSCNNPDEEGIYVRRVYPNSVFDTLEEGDIITNVSYEDVSALDVINRDKVIKTRVNAKLDKFGDLTLDLLQNKPYGNLRKMSLKELFDIIPINAEVSLTICRRKNGFCESNTYGIMANFNYVLSNIRTYIYPRFNKYKYVIVAGMCICELTMNHINRSNDLESYGKGKGRFKQALIVTQIFPNTDAYHMRVFSEGSIIKKINNIVTSTIDELKRVICLSGDYISFTGKNREKLVVKKSQIIIEDANIVKSFEITDYVPLL